MAIAGVGALAGCMPSTLAATSVAVVARLPHDPEAFTEGLVVVDGHLFESTGEYGQSTVRETDLASGTLLAEHHLQARYFGEGLAAVDDRLIQLTWKAGVAFVYERQGLKPVGEFHYAGQGWGLTYDGNHLIMSDGSSTLQLRRPDDFARVGQIDVHRNGIAIENLNELEYVDGHIWANVWLTDNIVIIDPASGNVIQTLDAASLHRRLGRLTDGNDVLNGIAFDSAGQHLYVTGKRWPVLFELRYPPARPRADLP